MLKGCKVTLRKKRWEDVFQDYAWKTNNELCQLDATSPLDISFSEFSSRYREELLYSDGRSHHFAIDTLEGRHIGNCMYYNLDNHRRDMEIGIIIGDPSYWSRGYGTEAITLLVNYVFQETKIKRIYLRTLDWNIRAHKCFEKCGFIPCEHLAKGGYNFIIMELPRSWWEENLIPFGLKNI
jgi:RimJ/RimL family protein N-acetyltransferase